MKHVYITDSGLENENNETIDVSPATVSAAKRGTVTNKLRHAVRAALNEEIVLVDKRAMKKFYATCDNIGWVSHMLAAIEPGEAIDELLVAIETGEAMNWVADGDQDLDVSEADACASLGTVDGWSILELRC